MERTFLPVIEQDEWLRPVASEIEYRHQLYLDELRRIERNCGSLYDFANAHLFFGIHRDGANEGYWIREWLPGAKFVSVFGDFNDWDRNGFPMEKDCWGSWSVFIPDSAVGGRLQHGSLFKLFIIGADDSHMDRLPVYIRRVVQDEQSKDYSAQVWDSQPFNWGDDDYQMSNEIDNLLIYEAHVGMATEDERVGTYKEFTLNVLPYIKDLGYNTIQLMAIAEHPYYGSFGYHVSSMFAPSSRFGTPEDLKELVKTAHSMGIGVIMDLVHSHYVKNTAEGFNKMDGTDTLYSPAGEAGDHPHWDSKLFDYGKHEVLHLLLSNVKYWLDEFHFDGYRFDGVTSMIYYNHGYNDFGNYHSYFGDGVNRSALTYLKLANKLAREVKPEAITIAEEVSGMPSMTNSITDGGIGFSYRLAMALPDFWIKYLKEKSDEQWNLWEMWTMMNNRLQGTKTIGYCESHDQALVGDKTLAFRLMDKEMYFSMSKQSGNMIVDRGVALHKMIRLFTITLGGDGYLTFMGNEFGHPEWIDFPREGNNWSYAHARRQWSLVKAENLRYGDLLRFDRAMIELTKTYHILSSGYGYNLLNDEHNKTMVFEQGGLVYVFNWHTRESIPNYRIPVPLPGKYTVALTSDATKYGGFGRIEEGGEYFSFQDNGRHYIQIYNVNRTTQVFKLIE